MEGRRVSVLTAPTLGVSAQLTPVAEALFPDLKRIAAVPDTDTGAGFAAVGLLPVVDDDSAPGMALAAAVLTELGVEPVRIEAWMVRRRELAAGQPHRVLAIAA